MSSVESSSVFDDLLDLLAEGTDTERLASFRLPPEKQKRLDDLLERNRGGSLSPADRSELDTFAQVEHLVRLLKSRLLQKNK